MSTDPNEVDLDSIYERNRRIWFGLDGGGDVDDNSAYDDDYNIDNPKMPADGEDENKKKNSLKNIPFLPKNLGTPKNVIPHWYERRHKGYYFKSNECFFSWNDGGKPHEMFHTSIFKCPVTGELFGSGQFGDNKSLYRVRKESINAACDNDDEKVAIVWHRKKKDAEHAAAARALDCLSFREGEGILSMCYGLCEEDPYLLGDEESKFVVPSSMPSTFFDWLENAMDTQEVVEKEQPQRQNENIEEELLHYG